MSKLNVAVQTRLKVVPITRNLLRAGNAGEFCFNLGCSELDTRVAQEGFARGLFKRLVIHAVDGNGHAMDTATFAVDHNGNAGDKMVSIDADDTVSHLERTDPGLAEAVRRTAVRFQRKGLRPVPRFWYRDDIAANPALRAQHNRELGIVDATTIETAPGYELIPIAKVTPGKDKLQSVQLHWGKKRS